MKFTIDRIDHLVLTCADLTLTASWYQRVLGMERHEFGGERRTALRFGAQKINLHEVGHEFVPHAKLAKPGTLDLCFITAVGPLDVVAHLHGCGVEIIQGPVHKEGALGPMNSVYCRDPDGNLIEISTYLED
ncbi:MAG: VOC family virulence protein [Rhodospirillales bacterium 20-60-12]|jgi:catechol 2,3-dioxygenase-like lactoylglutathione lyase family enzyme|nr:MAG: VOC family virulence protein [Rhodospirillales bacterium 20-60-12]HQT66736.1 VOC family protein [Acetobacteraceae bacterium]HQU01205.1 VOC family protein [Acetobacteraceae bacterium]